MTSRTYIVVVTREDGWLMIRIPALSLITQARDPGEVELVAREVIAVELDIEPDNVQVEVQGVRAV
jgi:hypothetical protein